MGSGNQSTKIGYKFDPLDQTDSIFATPFAAAGLGWGLSDPFFLAGTAIARVKVPAPVDLNAGVVISLPADTPIPSVAAIELNGSSQAGFQNPSPEQPSAPPAPALVSFTSEATAQAPVTVTNFSNPGPVGKQGSLLLVAGLARATGSVLGAGSTSDDTIAGRAIDSAAIVSLTASIDGGAVVNETGAIGPGGSFTLTPAMIAALAGGTVADGSHTVVVNATDASNNTTSAGVAFTLDSVTPTLSAGLVQITGTTTLAQTLGATSNDTVSGVGSNSAGIISLYGTLDGLANITNFASDIVAMGHSRSRPRYWRRSPEERSRTGTIRWCSRPPIHPVT